MQTVQASLGCWNAIRLRALILGPLGISAGAMLVLIEWRDPEWLPWALGVVGLVSVVFAYWMLLGVVNRWTVTADRRGVVAQFGPLPWVWGTRAFPAADIRGFLSAENIVDMGDHEARIVALRSSYGSRCPAS